MKKKGVTGWLFTFAIVCNSLCGQNQMSPVTIGGLREKYGSCEPVNFSVENTNSKSFYAEVYVEDLVDGNWKLDTYPYDVHAPVSLYEKRILTKADVLEPGTQWHLTYHRCIKPHFVKQTTKEFTQSIRKKDRTSISPVEQRFRVGMYAHDSHGVKLIENAWSKPFGREDKDPEPK